MKARMTTAAEWRPHLDAEQYRSDLKARGSHTGIALARGLHQCATCEEPWPCRRLRKLYPRVDG